MGNAMKNISRMIVIIISFGILSCATVYVPNVVNTPMLDKAADVQIGVYGGNNGFDLQTAAAITDNIAIMANGAFLDETTDSANYRKRKFAEAALGYYHPFGKSGRFDIFAGYGAGRTYSMDTYELFGVNTDYVEGSYSRIFIQPSIGAEFDVVDIGIAFRVSFIKIYSLKDKDQYINFEPKYTYYEPFFFVRVGPRYFKFSAQLGLSLPDQKTFYTQGDILLSGGIIINLFN